MNRPYGKRPAFRRSMIRCTAMLAVAALGVALPALAQDHEGDHDRDDLHFYPGNLVLSRSVYDNNAANVKIGIALPPNCPSTAKCPKGTTQYDGTFPTVFNNASYDGSFGITSKILLDQITPWGWTINTLEVPNSSQAGVTSSTSQLVSSFSSKSELALNLSTSGDKISFMGYDAPVDAIDVSNANTPLVVDPTNPDGLVAYRAAATLDRWGKFTFTLTNAYSGNNGRAAILNDSNGNDFFYTSGNAGNGKNPQPAGVVAGAGAQMVTASTLAESAQSPALPTPLGSFNVTQLGDPADKLGKDDNFRGLTVFNNVVYFTKGSGGNGVNTVYFVDTTGTACPGGVGLPAEGAKLPTNPLSYSISTVATLGLPNNMCILAGFPTALASGTVVSYPFGLWFADDHTLYVADEGDGYASASDLYTHAATQNPTAGLQKWVFDDSSKTWKLAYTLTSGLELGTAYTVNGYPTGNNAGNNNLPWAPATDGLRNITGIREGDYAIIWGITSTVSGSGDQGADPNRLVVIRDELRNTDASKTTHEKFYTLRTAGFAEVLRGICFTPGTTTSDHNGDGDQDRW